MYSFKSVCDTASGSNDVTCRAFRNKEVLRCLRDGHRCFGALAIIRKGGSYECEVTGNIAVTKPGHCPSCDTSPPGAFCTICQRCLCLTEKEPKPALESTFTALHLQIAALLDLYECMVKVKVKR